MKLLQIAGFLMLFLAIFRMGFSQKLNLPIEITDQSKPKKCKGKGLVVTEAVIQSLDVDNYVVGKVFLQKYNEGWEVKTVKRKGGGAVRLHANSCDYTGNIYTYACFLYSKNCEFPSVATIQKIHDKRGSEPKFRVTDKEEIDCTEGKGFFFKEGEVFTPNGEPVKISLFLKTKEGKWMKKVFRFYGSGRMPINIGDCSLNGEYKVQVELLKKKKNKPTTKK